MFNQACPGVPVAAISKVGVPWSPTATAQQIRFRTIGLTLFDRGHVKDVPLLSERFSSSYQVIDSPKFTEAT